MRTGKSAADLRIDSGFPIECTKEVAIFSQTFRGSQQKEAIRFEGIVKGSNDLFLKRLVEIDEHVAAEQQVDVGEGRIGTQILPGKDTAIADAF